MDVVAALDAPCAPRHPSKGPEGTTSPPPLSESETDDVTAAAKVDAASHVAGVRARGRGEVSGGRGEVRRRTMTPAKSTVTTAPAPGSRAPGSALSVSSGCGSAVLAAPSCEIWRDRGEISVALPSCDRTRSGRDQAEIRPSSRCGLTPFAPAPATRAPPVTLSAPAPSTYGAESAAEAGGVTWIGWGLQLLR